MKVKTIQTYYVDYNDEWVIYDYEKRVEITVKVSDFDDLVRYMNSQNCFLSCIDQKNGYFYFTQIL